MSPKLLLNAILICACAAGGTVYLADKSDKAVNPQIEQVPKRELRTVKNSKKPVSVKTVQPRTSGSTVTLQKDPRNGHFWANARVNSGRVHFLVDTGASSVALTLNDAKKIGLKVRDLNYNVPVSTAGGTNYAASVTLKSVSIGAITLRDVDALVIREGLTTSLLGMSYLGELQKVEATRDTLFLRL